MNIGRQLIRGSLLSGAEQAVRAVAALAITPVMVSGLGVADFGIWVLLAAFFSQLVLLDPGLQASLPRFFSKPDARGDDAELRAVASTGFAIYLLVTAATMAVAAVVWLLMPCLIADTSRLESARWSALMIGVSTSITALTRLFPVFLISRLRREVISFTAIARVVICTAVIAWLLMEKGGGLIEVAAVHSAGGVIEALALVWFGRDLLPRIRAGDASRATARSLLSYSGWSYLISVSERLRSGLDGFVLGWLRGSPAAGVYSLGLRPVTMVFDTVYACIGNQLLPAFTRIQETGGRERLVEAFLRVTRLSAFVSFLSAAVVTGIGPDFLRWWIPDQAEAAAPVLLWLALPFALQSAQAPAIHLLYALAEHRSLALAQAAGVLLNLALSILFARWFGIVGAAMGTAVEIFLLHGLVMPWLIAKQAGVSAVRFIWRGQAIPLLIALPLLAVAWWRWIAMHGGW